MSKDPDVIKKQIKWQIKKAVEHLNTDDESAIMSFVKSHIIYPGSIHDKPMADINEFGDDFLNEEIRNAVNQRNNDISSTNENNDKSSLLPFIITGIGAVVFKFIKSALENDDLEE